MASIGQDRGICLKSPSASTQSKAADITKQPWAVVEDLVKQTCNQISITLF